MGSGLRLKLYNSKAERPTGRKCDVPLAVGKAAFGSPNERVDFYFFPPEPRAGATV